mgnify:FL=1
MYKKLQEFLNECISKWLNPRKIKWDKIYTFKTHITVYSKTIKWWDVSFGYSYNDLFSIESWVMEFVNRKLPIIAYELGNSQWEYRLWHYMIMTIIKDKQKIQYFLENALLPDTDATK